MVGCEKIPAAVGIQSNVGLANIMVLQAGTAFVLVDLGLDGVLLLVAAGHVITAADYGTTSDGATGGTFLYQLFPPPIGPLLIKQK